jgi:hypothetical protein
MPKPFCLAALALLCLPAACGNPDGAAPTQPLGTYVLRSVDGQGLPWTQAVYSPVDSTLVVGRSLEFRPDSSYTLHLHYRFVQRGISSLASYELTGHYQLRGDSLTFIDYQGFPAPYPGRFRDPVVTVRGSVGEEYLYSK